MYLQSVYASSLLLSILVEKRLADEVRKNDILIIVGETGSGKTTRKLYIVFFESISDSDRLGLSKWLDAFMF